MTGDSTEFFWRISEAYDSGIYVSGWGGELDSCSQQTAYNSFIMKMDENGNIDLTYGEDGYYRPKQNCDHYFLENRITEGPSGELVTLESMPNYNQDSTMIEYYNHRFIRVNPIGKADYTFGTDGKLDLDFIPGGIILNVAMDKDYNLYIMSTDNLDTSIANNNIYISKIKAEKIWTYYISASQEPFQLLIYPNPALGTSKLKNQGLARTNLIISLFDITGRLVSTKEIEKLDQDEEVAISNRQLSAGTYLVKVSDSITRSTFWEKIVVVE